MAKLLRKNTQPSTDVDQEIIEVSQTTVKRALRALLEKQNNFIAMLYNKHDEYNKDYFENKLSVPIITIDKMSNKTLGSYNSGTDNLGLENHIRLNRNFVALNEETRILETLRHEMIHQYQDEVLYEKKDDKGIVIREGQKRPKEWHNKDFRDYAAKVSIPAIGKNACGNPAKMPEAKSYNRKFVCGCKASNGYPVTIWSTREVNAVCTICGKPFTEVKKSGGTIAVVQSTVEAEGQDSIKTRMLETFNTFEQFKSKKELEDKLKSLKNKYQYGMYQKGHTAYSKGHKYWAAWNVTQQDTSSENKKPAMPKRRQAPSILKKRGAVNNDKNNDIKQA